MEGSVDAVGGGARAASRQGQPARSRLVSDSPAAWAAREPAPVGPSGEKEAVAVLFFFNLSFFWFKEKTNDAAFRLGKSSFTLCISPIFSLLPMSLCSASTPFTSLRASRRLVCFFSFLLSLPTFLHSEKTTRHTLSTVDTHRHAHAHAQPRRRNGADSGHHHRQKAARRQQTQKDTASVPSPAEAAHTCDACIVVALHPLVMSLLSSCTSSSW